MSRKIKVLAIGGAALLVLVAAMIVLLVTNTGGASSSSGSDSSTITLRENNVNNVTKLSVKNQKGEYEIQQKEAGVYSIDALGTLPTDQLNMKYALSSLAVLQASKVVTDSPKDLAEYGLDHPSVAATATFNDGKTVTFYVGIKSPTSSSSYYAMIAGENTVYLISRTSYEYIMDYTAKDYVDKQMVNIELKDNQTTEDVLQSISIKRKDLPHEMVFEQKENDEEDKVLTPATASVYMMTSPIKAYTSNDTFSNISACFTSLEATSVVAAHPTADQLAQYGFNDPTAVATGTMFDGTKVVLRVGNGCYGDPGATSSDSSSAANVTGYYIMVDGIDAVYYGDASFLKLANVSEFDLLSQIAFAPSIASLSKLTITIGNDVYAIDYAHSGDSSSGSTTATVNGKAVNDDILTKFHEYVVSALAEGLHLDTPGGSPLVTLKFEYTGGYSPTTVAFHDIGDRRASITINGQTRFETRMTYVTNLISNVKAFVNNQAINPNY